MLYLYAFTKYAGFDKVFVIKDENLKFKEGDLIQQGSEFFLVLGEQITFPELYITLHTGNFNFSLVYPGFLSSPTLQMLHRMVYEWYSPYKNVIKLFIEQDIEKLLQKEIKPNKKIKKSEFILGDISITNDSKDQILVVFPDLWTVNNYLDQENESVFLLSSLDSTVKKRNNWWKIKKGNENLIFSTSSEIFQDFYKLKDIYFVEPQKWYYASQQDPRYKVEIVLKKMSELYRANIHIINSENLGK